MGEPGADHSLCAWWNACDVPAGDLGCSPGICGPGSPVAAAARPSKNPTDDGTALRECAGDRPRHLATTAGRGQLPRDETRLRSPASVDLIGGGGGGGGLWGGGGEEGWRGRVWECV